MNLQRINRLVAATMFLALGVLATPADAQIKLRSICRVKGQEEIVLHGQGIVVGLKGTGDGEFMATRRSLGIALQKLGNPLGQGGINELKDAKNVAVVLVTATVPAAGARQGDTIDCVVSSLGAAKSLEGGRLFVTALTGPDTSANPRVFGFAQGPITLDSPEMTTTGRIHKGCRLEEDFFNPYTKDDKITLVLDENHTGFQVAQDVVEAINGRLSFQVSGGPVAKALNQANIEVIIPPQYRDDPVMFVAQVLGVEMLQPRTGAIVTINERAGSIVISADVEIGAVVITHKNFVIDTTNAGAASRFVALDPGQTETPKLEALIAALKAVHAPTEDIIEIIKCLARNKKLHARLVIQ
jgi:flagellar P-ring protein precursor FlgI